MATLTTNQNFLQPTGYKVQIDRSNYPNLEFFAQTIAHPSVSNPSIEVPYKRVTTHISGEKLIYDEISIEILLDEDMKAYQEMHDWLKRLVEEANQMPSRRGIAAPSTSDITLTLLSSHNNLTKKFIYRDCVPTSLGSVNFKTNTTDVEFITVAVSFTFSYFDIV